MDEFEAMDGGAAEGGATVSARSIARAAAAAAVHGTTNPERQAIPQQRDDSQTPLESDEGLTAQFEDGDLADVVDTDGGIAAAAVAVETVLSSEEVAALSEYGIDLPVSADALPVEAQDAYSRLAQSALQAQRDADSRVQESQTQAMNVLEAMKDLQTRLTTPEGLHRLLLTVALTQGDVFKNAVEQADRMATDPQYADVVRRGLEAETRLEAAQRMERAAQASQTQSKGRQIEDRTTRLAKRFGLDEGLAREMVASRILQNAARNGGRRDISFQEVDEVMGNLAKRMGKGAPAPKGPEAARKAAQAPKPAPARQPAPPVAERQVGPQARPATDPLGKLRAAIRGSAQNLRSKGL